jgi:hypothetical protein
MANTYEYIIKVISTDTARINKQEFPNTIRAIHWDLKATDENGNVEIIPSITTFVKFMSRHTGSFTPYNDVTRNQVINWIDEAADTDSMKFGIDLALSKADIPVSTNHINNLPWNT